jgi:hypothetical protein
MNDERKPDLPDDDRPTPASPDDPFMPIVEPDEERHALADQAAELRKQRMTYQQIADGLDLGSSHVARALLVDYHPDLIEVRAKRPRKAKEPRFCAARRPGQEHAY